MKHKLFFEVLTISIMIFSCNGEHSKTENSSELEVKTIPGLTAADVHGNLTNKGFILEKNLTAEGSSWTCKSSDTEKDLIVVVFGDSPTSILNVKGTVLNYSTEKTADIAKEFLGYLASLPYENSQPTIARDWVINNIETGGTTTIGNVKFEIFANGERNRILSMTGI